MEKNYNFKKNEKGNVEFIRPSGNDYVLSEMPEIAVNVFIKESDEPVKMVDTDYGKALEAMVGDMPYRFLIKEEPKKAKKEEENA